MGQAGAVKGEDAHRPEDGACGAPGDAPGGATVQIQANESERAAYRTALAARRAGTPHGDGRGGGDVTAHALGGADRVLQPIRQDHTKRGCEAPAGGAAAATSEPKRRCPASPACAAASHSSFDMNGALAMADLAGAAAIADAESTAASLTRGLHGREAGVAAGASATKAAAARQRPRQPTDLDVDVPVRAADEGVGFAECSPKTVDAAEAMLGLTSPVLGMTPSPAVVPAHQLGLEPCHLPDPQPESQPCSVHGSPLWGSWITTLSPSPPGSAHHGLLAAMPPHALPPAAGPGHGVHPLQNAADYSYSALGLPFGPAAHESSGAHRLMGKSPLSSAPGSLPFCAPTSLLRHVIAAAEPAPPRPRHGVGGVGQQPPPAQQQQLPLLAAPTSYDKWCEPPGRLGHAHAGSSSAHASGPGCISMPPPGQGHHAHATPIYASAMVPPFHAAAAFPHATATAMPGNHNPLPTTPTLQQQSSHWGKDPPSLPLAAVVAHSLQPGPRSTPAVRQDGSERATWTVQDDAAIFAAIAVHGCRWRRIATLLPGRTDDAVRNRWHRLERIAKQQAQCVVHNDTCLTAGARMSTWRLAFTRYCFTSKLYCGSPSSCPPTCKAYPIAILSYVHWAIYAPPPPPPFMPYTIQY